MGLHGRVEDFVGFAGYRNDLDLSLELHPTMYVSKPECFVNYLNYVPII